MYMYSIVVQSKIGQRGRGPGAAEQSRCTRLVLEEVVERDLHDEREPVDVQHEQREEQWRQDPKDRVHVAAGCRIDVDAGEDDAQRVVDKTREHPDAEEEHVGYGAADGQLEVRGHFEQLEEDVGHVVRDEHQRADAHPIEPPAEPQERQRHHVVYCHLAPVLRADSSQVNRGKRGGGTTQYTCINNMRTTARA